MLQLHMPEVTRQLVLVPLLLLLLLLLLILLQEEGLLCVQLQAQAQSPLLPARV